MSAMSRRKGATYENEIAGQLHDRLGITFRRDLEQYRATERGDLIPDDEAFPFVIECKRHAEGVNCLAAWKAQAVAAAKAARKRPAVIFRFDRQQTRVAVPLSALCDAWPADDWAEVSLDGFCLLAREIMAEPGNWTPNDFRDLRGRIVGKDAE